MKKFLLLTVISVFTLTFGYSQTSLWKPISDSSLNTFEKVERSAMPKEYELFKIDFAEMKLLLQSAPPRESAVSDLILDFPNANGKIEKFRIFEASVMESELAERHSDIKSYIGKGITNPTATIHFTTTIFGLHTMTLDDNGTQYIDPYTKDLNSYIVYNKSSISKPRNFSCGVVDEELHDRNPSFENTTLANDGTFRTYRLAMACTVEYAAFHVNAANLNAGTLAQKKAAVLAAMTVTVARVNSVFERDMSLRLVLVANNENVIFVDSDNFTNSPDMINEIQPIVNAAIGAGNYEIGHGVCTTDSGIAQLQSVCGQFKARGITGQPNPVGDSFDIDYVIHEMGHQFGATHTQNNDCQRSTSTAVEPGSASTIMGYAGICDPNVQNNSDAYFHAVSLNQMFNFVTTGATCSTNISNGNTPPVITSIPNYTIPVGTPFSLTATATDANGDALTYCWEQTNVGTTSATPNGTSTTNPNFRSLSPTTNPKRYFPSLTNSYGAWEVLPTVAKTMNFALTVRDNRSPNGGQTSRQNMSVSTSTAGGPFIVTSQSTSGISWTQGQSETITWNVANTTSAPFNTANVRILLSTDGGLTYTTLVETTPNDGTQAITVPNVAAPFCRIMIESIGNVYYALNSVPFAIGFTVTNTCNTYNFTTPFAIPDGNPNYTVRQISVPTTANVSDVNVAVNLTHTWLSDVNIAIVSPQNTQLNIFNRGCDNDGTTQNLNATFDDQGTAANCTTTITGNVLPAEALSIFNGQNPQGNWLFGVRDLANQDTGSVQSFAITICSQTAVLNTENFGLANFKIYPNPNKGNFTVQFDSNSGNKINVMIYDIRGRQIFNEAYQNTGVFNQNLELNNVQSGVYMVTVEDGEKKETRKIVIQ